VGEGKSVGDIYRGKCPQFSRNRKGKIIGSFTGVNNPNFGIYTGVENQKKNQTPKMVV